jgi:hypothetical protein
MLLSIERCYHGLGSLNFKTLKKWCLTLDHLAALRRSMIHLLVRRHEGVLIKHLLKGIDLLRMQ